MEGFFSTETSSYTNLMIGSTAEIQCGNVSGVNYTWRGATNEILTNPLTISPVSVSYGQSNYTCTASIPSNPMNCQTQVENIVLNIIGKYEVVSCIVWLFSCYIGSVIALLKSIFQKYFSYYSPYLHPHEAILLLNFFLRIEVMIINNC